jgi:hypothetical protein
MDGFSSGHYQVLNFDFEMQQVNLFDPFCEGATTLSVLDLRIVEVIIINCVVAAGTKLANDLQYLS